MGRKYASLHIKAKEAVCTEEKLLQAYNRLSKTMPAIDLLNGMQKLGFSPNGKEVQLFNAILDSFTSTIEIQKHNGFMSILDRELSFESVEEKALGLSRELDMDVLFTSVFDDDVFFFGLCRKGQCVAEHVSGQCEAYGLEKAQKNIGLLENWLSNDPGVKLNLENKEEAEFEAALQSKLGFPLDEA